MRILFVGNLFSDSEVKRNPAANQAAHKWNLSFVKSLLENDIHVECLSYKPARLWPRGSAYITSDVDDFSEIVKIWYVNYFNIPIVRNFSIYLALLIRYFSVRSIFNYDAVLYYNLYPWNRWLLKSIRFLGGKEKLLPIILDHDDPRSDNWRSFCRQSRGSDGLVFLSYWGSNYYPGEIPSIHFCGGVDFTTDELLQDRKGGKLKILYSGKFERRYGGLEGLLKIIKGLDKERFEVFLTGKIVDESVTIFKDLNCEYLGYIDDVELLELAKDVDVFLNYRPRSVPDNVMIFPSKLLFYLSFSKPIVSSYTPGISPEFEKFVQLIDNDDPEFFIASLESLYHYSRVELDVKNLPKTRIVGRDWLWENRVRKLIEFIQAI